MDNAQQPLDNAEPTMPGAEPVATPSENNNNIPHDVPAEPVTTPTSTVGPVANPPEKNKAGLIIVIFVILLVVSGAIAAVFLLNNNADDKKKDDETAQEEKKDEEEVETVQLSERQLARNAIRENTIVLIVSAARDYQTNNNGKTPFGTNNAIASDYTKFVQRYIEPDVSVAKFGETTCSKGKKCQKFADPDGTVASFKVYKQSEINQILVKVETANKVDHVIYVGVGTKCSSNNKSAVPASSDRVIALFYMDETTMLCNDNR